MTEHRFHTPEPLEVYVESTSGRVSLEATDTTETHVDLQGDGADDTVVELDGRRLRVIAPRQRGFFSSSTGLVITLTVPSGSALATKLGSADVSCRGVLDAVEVRTGSGDVDLERAEGPTVVETGSGEVRVGHAAGALRVKSGSGDVHVDRVVAQAAVSTGSGDVSLGETGESGEPVVVKTGSGALTVGAARHDVGFKTGSGSLRVERQERGRLTSKGASGDVRVGIPAGTPVWTDITTVSGRLRSELESVGQPEPGAPHVELRVTTASGDITLNPA